MKISIIQYAIVWAEPATNMNHLTEMMKAVPKDSDLIILPEMFATGFAVQPEGAAESEDGATLTWMRRTAATRNCAIAGSVAVEVGKGQFRNRFYFVKPDGSAEYYDKHHLFTYGGEHERYTAGQERVVVEWRGVRFLLQVCYDLRFPLWSRNREDYDCTLYVASWPTPRIEAWTALLRARAIENQCYVVGVNRIGTDPHCDYCGASVIIDPYGRNIVACKHDEECIATALLDINKLNTFRQKFPVLKDRDPLG